MNLPTRICSAFWLSDCGQYIARSFGDCDYDVMTVDGSKCWLARRYQPKGWKDKDPRYTHPEFAHITTSYSNESIGKKEAFKIGFADVDLSKRIVPLTGNCIIESYEARFSRLLNIRARAIKPNVQANPAGGVVKG